MLHAVSGMPTLVLFADLQRWPVACGARVYAAACVCVALQKPYEEVPDEDAGEPGEEEEEDVADEPVAELASLNRCPRRTSSAPTPCSTTRGAALRDRQSSASPSMTARPAAKIAVKHGGRLHAVYGTLRATVRSGAGLAVIL